MLRATIEHKGKRLFEVKVDKNVDEFEMYNFCDIIRRFYNCSDKKDYVVNFFVDEVPDDYCVVPTYSRALKIMATLIEDDENKEIKLFEKHKDRYYTQEEHKKLYKATLTIYKRAYDLITIYDSTFFVTNYPVFKESVTNYVNYCYDKLEQYIVKIRVANTSDVFEFAYDDLKTLMKVVERLETDF